MAEVVCQVPRAYGGEVFGFRLRRRSAGILSAYLLHGGETDTVGGVTKMGVLVDLGERTSVDHELGGRVY